VFEVHRWGAERLLHALPCKTPQSVTPREGGMQSTRLPHVCIPAGQGWLRPSAVQDGYSGSPLVSSQQVHTVCAQLSGGQLLSSTLPSRQAIAPVAPQYADSG
jgi:hypothetical protein